VSINFCAGCTLNHFGYSQPLYVCKEIQTFGDTLSPSLHISFQWLNENGKVGGIAGTKNIYLKNNNKKFETNGMKKNFGDLCRGFHKFRWMKDSELTQ
jgi:hypothetical protein